MKFGIIIPDRGDRPDFFSHCMWQIARFTLKPDHVFCINYAPESENVDLVQRVRVGVERAIQAGIDLVFIIENDDAYPADYFNRFQPYFEKFDFFGDERTTYYNLRNKTYRTWHHPYRASLFTTGFKISALNNFSWPSDDELFLDIKLWRYARHRRKKFVDTGAVGIKHGLGKTGGKGHYMRFKDVDVDWRFLQSKVNGSLDFYKNLKL